MGNENKIKIKRGREEKALDPSISNLLLTLRSLANQRSVYHDRGTRAYSVGIGSGTQGRCTLACVQSFCCVEDCTQARCTQGGLPISK